MSKRAGMIVVFALMVLVAVPLALAGNTSNSVVAGYGGNSGNVLAQVKPTSTGSTLPFTGLDLALFAVGGAALVAVGLGIRRAGRNHS